MTCFYIVVNGGCAGVEAREGGPSCMRGHEQLVDSDDDLSDPSFKAGRKRKGANEFSCCISVLLHSLNFSCLLSFLPCK